MVKVNPLQPSLNAGEFGPRMHGRVDFSKYPSAGRTFQNLIPIAQGGAMRRAGTRYVAAVKTAADKTRLLRFEFSTTQAYVLEVGDAYIRFFRNQGQITVPNTDSSITNGTFDSNINDWDDRSTGGGSIAHDGTNNDMDLVPGGTGASDIGWAEQDVTNTSAVEHVLRFQVKGAPGDKIELRIGTSSTGTEIVNDVEFQVGYHSYAFTATGATFYIQFRNLGSFRNKTVSIDNVSLIDDSPMELTTPYAKADLFELKTAQSADVLYIAHPSYKVYKLTRSGHTSWSLVEVAWDDGPYLDENTTDTTFTTTATSGLGLTLTASAAEGINDGAGFAATDVGRLLRVRTSSSEPGWAVIVSRASATSVGIDIRRDFPSTAAHTRWRLGSWSDTTGWPGAVAFFEQRIAFARSTDQPQTFWLGQSADLENMRPDSYDTAITIEDDDALNFTLAADQANVIQWLSPGKQLALGTSGGVWVAESDGPTLTPTDVQVRRHTTHGCADVSPVRVDDVAVYVQRAKRKLREFAFVFEVDSFQAPDLTILADHVTTSGINEIAYQEEPDSIVWCVRDDGVLAGMTYRRNQDVVGWHRTIIGGTFQTGASVVETVETIPGNNGAGQQFNSAERDELWFIVKRTVNSATVRHVEFVEKDFTGPARQDYTSDALWEAAVIDAQQDAFYVDAGLTLDTAVTISGATAADPVVVTATAHGFSNGDQVAIRAVKGMTELNGNAYQIVSVAANTFELIEIEDVIGISGATQANPVVITTPSAHGLSNNDVIGITGVGGMTEINNKTFTVANVTSTTFELSGEDGTGHTAYTSGGTIYHAVDGTGFTAYDSSGEVRKEVTSITGLDHLEGEAVGILANGAIHPNKTVSSGAVTLDYKASRVHAGLRYKHKLETLKMAAGAQAGTAVARIKRISGVTLLLLDTGTFKIGPNDATLEDVEFREVGDAMDTAVPLFTGERHHDFEGDYDRDPVIYFESDNPLPFVLLGIAPEVRINEQV